MRRTHAIVCLLAGGLLLAGCGSDVATPTDSPVAVATTTQLGSILGDITSCAGNTSTTLMGPGDDPHTFAVSSSQVADLVRAKLVVANGLGLEEGLASTLDNVRADGGRVLEVAPQLDPLTFAEIEEAREAAHEGHEHAAEEEGHTDEHAHGEFDPHVHLDASRMARAATLIGAELADASGEDQYATCGKQVHDALMETHEQVIATLAPIPAERRVLVTDHEAFNYFAAAYGFTVAGVVIPGGSTDAEPSSADLADLVEVIREDNIPAIFSNNTVNPALVEALGRETGTAVQVVQLFEGSLGAPGSGADTYSSMMTTNARLIADALA